ncbi:tRNA (N6-isopentenyl adenosine(37)-C2)-methylthiotransferase MiaB [Candidatus Fermentibacteria bacterium]|nr:tRNA (N6-isopentenyl adenosine(37)-C2)-methylthiotransferase MiaB [Candidatus Fermentibacteria bacterium]
MSASPGSYFIDVYGCQMNVRDAELIRGILEEAGLQETEDSRTADVILLVSCAVREHAETRVLGRLTQLASLRKKAGGPSCICLCGCVAREHGDDLLDRFPGLDLVVGPDCYRDLPGLIRSGTREAVAQSRREHYENVPSVGRAFPRAFVTVMRGCDNYCAYCIVPLVRGRERSRSFSMILAEVEELRERGFGEVALLGQNVNSYRYRGTGFPRLLDSVAERAGRMWVRFVTSHPKDFSQNLVEVIAARPNVCNQVHLPVQSGSSEILRRMGRGYTREDYLSKVRMLRRAVPDVVISTDMMAGFPGETEEDFRSSVTLLEEVAFDYAFLFRYSERKGTRACGMENAVPEEERLGRLHVLQEVQRGITLRRSRRLVGGHRKVLVTGEGKMPGQRIGRTEGNRVVVLEEPSLDPGSFAEVRITGADGWTHMGSLERVCDR